MSDVLGPAPNLLPAADRRLAASIEAMSEASYAQPSQLPGWSRAHVLAHLALNAEGLAGVLDGATRGNPPPMYSSPEARDSEIDDLAAEPVAAVRERALTSITQFAQQLGAILDEDDASIWAGRFERTPGGVDFPLAALPLMRVREVEIHHVDLGVDYCPSDWSEAFRTLLLDSLTARPYPSPFVVRADDLSGMWEYGEGGGGPRVTGRSGALGWWLTGRGDGEGLSSDSGELPTVTAW